MGLLLPIIDLGNLQMRKGPEVNLSSLHRRHSRLLWRAAAACDALTSRLAVSHNGPLADQRACQGRVHGQTELQGGGCAESARMMDECYGMIATQ